MTKSVWVVTYWGEKEEPTVSIFDNEENARKAYDYFKELQRVRHQRNKVFRCAVHGKVF